MFKIILSAAFLFLFTELKAQQPKSKKTDVIEHREGGNPQLKAQQQQVKNEPLVIKKVDSVKTSAKMKSATANPTIPKPVDSLRLKVAPGRTISTDRAVDSLTKFIKG